MSAFSTALSQKIINSSLRGESFALPAGHFLALFSSDPLDDNTNTAGEITGGWYARQPTGAWAAPTTNVTSNSNQIQFAAVTGSPVSVSHWGIYDAITGGALLYRGALTTPKVLNVGDVLVVGAGQLQLTVD